MIPSWFQNTPFAGAEQYRDFHQIAHGGFGEIYSATYKAPSETREVIVKRLKPEWLQVLVKRERFEAEAGYLKKLHHPQIPQLIDSYLSETECFLVMEKIAGHSLEKLMSNAKALKKKIPCELAIEIILQLCDVLHYLHNYRDESENISSVIHCDVKPGNILVSPDFRVVLIDFTLASSITAEKRWAGGSSHYMGPERFAGEPPIPQSDLFGLMVTFFELLSGRPLLGKMKYFNIFATFLSEKYLETVKRQGLPKVLEKILLKGLAFKPEDRFESAAALAKQLREVQSTLGLTANRDKLLAELHDLSKIS